MALVLAAGGGLFGGSAPAAAASPWSHYDKTSGLVDNRVQAIARDAEGKLWVGTRKGLSRFDGARWRNITRDGGLPDDDINTIFIGPRGDAWIGTSRGFGLYRDGGWSRLGLPGTVTGEKVSVVSDGEGTIWFGYAGGLMSFRGDEEGLQVTEELTGTPVTALMASRTGDLWVGTGDGLRVFDGTYWTRYGSRDGLSPGRVTALLEDSRGTIWSATEGGLSEYSGIGWTAYGAGDGLPNTHVTALAEDRKGRVWIGTLGGAGWYDGYDWIWLDEGTGIPSEEVLALQADLNGAIWIGTSHGLTKYDTAWLALESVGYEEKHPRGPLLRDRDGILYTGSGEGMLVLDGRQVEHLGPGSNLSGRVNHFRADENGDIWIGTDNGLFIYSRGSLTHLSPPEYQSEIRRHEYGAESVKVRYFDRYNGLKDEMITALWGVSEEEMWVGTPKGLSMYADGSWDLVEENELLGKGEITALEGVAGEILWAGTPEGLWVRRDGEWSAVGRLAGRSVGALFRDRDGNLWAGTDRGIFRWNGDTWQEFDPGGGLSGSAVAAVFQDGSGAMWFGTEAGVAKFDGEHWSAFSEADGLHANRITSIIENGDELWFGSDEGVTSYRPDRAPPDTAVKNPPQGVVGASSYLFEFAAGEFETPLHGMRYSWKLDDGEWSPYGPEPRVTVTDIANGSHTFSVRSMDQGLNVDSSPADVLFQVDTGALDLEVVDASFKDLYASLYQFYASDREYEKDPVARVSVRNKFDRPLRTKVSFFIPGLMDFPSDRVVTIPAGEVLPVALRVELSEEVLRLEKTTSRQALLELQYTLRGEPKETAISYPVTVVEKHSMTWSEPERAGLYVTHLDGAVEDFARRVVAQFREDEKETIIYDNLLRAIELFDALGVHGVRYLADPDNPYGSIAGGGGVLDLIRFPRETLTLKSGDCDDVSVLYAALLQNIGIDTALVDVTDHVFVIFDTGLRRRQAGQVARDASQLYIDGQDRVWIPVETTLLGESFSEAWKVGAAMLAERKYEIIEIKEAWKRYPPLHLPDDPVLTAVPARSDIWPLFEQDLKIQERTLISDRVKKIQQRLDAVPGDIAALNELGILLAKSGYLRQAEARFRRVVSLAPEFSGGHSNLANVLYERELYDEAVERYHASLEIDPANPEVHVELALTYCETGRFDMARVHYRLAMELGGRPGNGEETVTAGERRKQQ
jgi:ligand-binding sensor domain-containing protein